jgi:hypothetical protein
VILACSDPERDGPGDHCVADCGASPGILVNRAAALRIRARAAEPECGGFELHRQP